MKVKGAALIASVALAMLMAPPPAAAAQRAAKVPRVGVLSPFLGPDSAFLEALRQGLRDLGYVEGTSVAFEYRAAESFDHLAALAGELVKMRVDVIVTAGPQGVRAAKNATSTIPIVMGNVGDAVAQGFVASLARPGGNLTGLSSLNTELSAKRLELLKELVPGVSHVAVLREAVGDAAPAKAAEEAARALGLKLLVLQVRGADELESAFAAMATSRVGAVAVLSSSLFASRIKELVELAGGGRLPAMFPDARFVRAGGLVSYGPDVIALYRRAAIYIDKILKGARPADLPVEQPTTFQLAVNRTTARRLRVAIPQSILIRADRVFESNVTGGR